MKDSRRLVPCDKFDIDAVQLIKDAGYPAIAPVLDDLVGWTADSNWPVARPLADFLVTLGEPLVDPLVRILRGHDGSQKEHTIRLVVKGLPVEILAMLEQDLRRLVEHPSPDDVREEANFAARDALARLHH